MCLVRRDLEDGVRRRVADRLAGADMLLAETGDDLRARGMAVAENAGHLRRAAERLDKLRRKGVALCREITPIESHRRSGDLPMARRRILAAGDFVGGAIDAVDLLRNRHAGRKAAGGGLARYASGRAPTYWAEKAARSASRLGQRRRLRRTRRYGRAYRRLRRHRRPHPARRRRRRNPERRERHAPSCTRSS